MKKMYLGRNLFWVYLRDSNKVVPFVWSNDRAKVKNIENGDVLEYLNDDRFLHDIIKSKYKQKEQTPIIEFPKVLSMLTTLEKGIYFGVDVYTNPNKILYTKRQIEMATKKIQQVLLAKEMEQKFQK